MNSEDPLEHADIGETKTVHHTKTIRLINYTPDVYFGGDRIIDNLEVDDVKLVEADDGGKDIEVTWEGDVTKRLPRNWDKHNVPITEKEKKAARLKKWKQRLAVPVITLLGMGASTLVAFQIMNTVAGEIVINGEPLPPPTPGSIFFIFAITVVIYVFVIWTARGALPRKI